LLFRKADGSVTEASAGAEEPQPPPAAAARRSILVVDDDPDVRGFIVEALEEQGYVVREAADGREGIAEVEREAPDLIVLDFIMPGMSGADVARRARERRPDQPILFVSGYSETEAVKSIAPDAPLLAKPFRADALHKAVRAALTPGD
jgi:CheY-like chemotaxis protein